jgi:hypothetical protein
MRFKEPCDYGGIIGWHKVFEHARGAGRRSASGTQVILYRDGNARERAQLPAFSPELINTGRGL